YLHVRSPTRIGYSAIDSICQGYYDKELSVPLQSQRHSNSQSLLTKSCDSLPIGSCKNRLLSVAVGLLRLATDRDASFGPWPAQHSDASALVELGHNHMQAAALGHTRGEADIEWDNCQW